MMFHPSRRNLIGALGLIPLSRILHAQEDNPAPAFSATVQVVNVFAAVHDKKGKLVADLTREDFLLIEDGLPQTIRYFSRGTDVPLTLGLLVDTSRSQLNLLQEERDASYRFFDKVLREDKDTAFVAHFDFDVEVLMSLSGSRLALQSALNRLKVGNRWNHAEGRGLPDVIAVRDGTHLYDAVRIGSETIMRNQHGRKALIVLSDGVDLGSKSSLNDAIESAQRSDTLIYSILFSDPAAYPRRAIYLSQTIQGGQPAATGKEILQRLSRETGGHSFEVSKHLPLDQVFEVLEDELRSQYSVGYTPNSGKSASQYHRIRLITKDKSLIVQAREGYYRAEK